MYLFFKLSYDNPIEIENFVGIYIEIINDLIYYENIGDNYIIDKEEGLVYHNSLYFCVTRIM